jgi:hypothetical protein
VPKRTLLGKDVDLNGWSYKESVGKGDGPAPKAAERRGTELGLAADQE